MTKKTFPLLNGCYRTEIAVSPKNWNTRKASLKEEWYIWYRFYCGAQSKLVKIRGMNLFKDLQSRQKETSALIESEKDLIDNQHYNPITKEYMFEKGEQLMPVTEDTLILEAIDFSYDKLDVDPDYKKSIKSTVKYVKQSIKCLEFSDLKISQIKRRHVTLILDHCAGTRKLSPTRYNQYRTDLILIFKKLIGYDCIEYNPAGATEKKKTIKKIRPVPTDQERKNIDESLKTNFYTFWRFVHIFYHSGARKTELLRLKKEDVNLEAMEYKVLLKKGGSYREVLKPIKEIALPLWAEIYHKAIPGQYLFSVGLIPGDQTIHPIQTARRWKRHIKEKLGVTADLYSLKHLNMTEVMDELSAIGDIESAKEETILLSSHTDSKMLDNVYDIKSRQRKGDRIKKVRNKFA